MITFSIISCNKEVHQSNENSLKTSNSKIANHPSIVNSKGASNSQNTISPYNSVREIINAFARFPIVMDSYNAVDPSPISDSANLVNMNTEVINYLQKYPSIGFIDPSYTTDPDFVIVSILYAYLEESGALSNGNFISNRFPVWLDCIISATVGYFDIRDMISNLATFEFGTVWRVVKFAVKKYMGWFGAALLIYHITTDCI